MARMTVEGLDLNGNWRLISEDNNFTCDTYKNLKARQGNADESWLKRVFSDNQKVETRVIGGETVRTTIVWED